MKVVHQPTLKQGDYPGGPYNSMIVLKKRKRESKKETITWQQGQNDEM